MNARLLNCLCLACSILAIQWWGIVRGEKAATSAVASYYERVLREKRIEPTATGLLRYFRALHPDEAYRRRVAQLVEELGSTESFAKREAAMAQLVVLTRPPREALSAAISGTDPEVRWRAKRILETAIPESERVLYAALRVAEEKNAEKKPLTPAPLPSGERGWGEGALAAELIRAVPLCDKPHLVYAVGETLQAVARPGDAQMLRGALESKNAEVRAAAVGALGKAIGRNAADNLKSALPHPATHSQ